MNCRVCSQPTIILRHYENMPARAQKLHDTPIEDVIDFNLCQCVGCGLVQLDCEPVEYWREAVQTDNAVMRERLADISKDVDFISFNYLEHVPQPNEYLQSLHGKGIIEVPNFDMFLENRLFHEIMRDHLCYFTADTLRLTLTYNGFNVISILPSWNDYILTAVVEKRKAVDVRPFEDARRQLSIELDEFVSNYPCVAIYGASHEAFAILAMCDPQFNDVCIIDDSPMKQCKFTPDAKIRIYSPDTALPTADAVIVMGAGYSDIILSKLNFKGALAVVRGDRLEVIRE